MKDIVDTAVSAGSSKTLVAAVQAAGLVDTLKSAGPFTVFAPTDGAFSNLPPGTVEGLFNDIPKLKSILTYHVVSGKVTSSQALEMTRGGRKNARTAQGADITLEQKGFMKKRLMLNNAEAVKRDIYASNGVIHVIDTVILPPA